MNLKEKPKGLYGYWYVTKHLKNIEYRGRKYFCYYFDLEDVPPIEIMDLSDKPLDNWDIFSVLLTHIHLKQSEAKKKRILEHNAKIKLNDDDKIALTIINKDTKYMKYITTKSRALISTRLGLEDKLRKSFDEMSEIFSVSKEKVQNDYAKAVKKLQIEYFKRN